MALLPGNDDEFTVETRRAPPTHLLIKIESFSLLAKQGIDKYESREFEAGDHKWKLVIYPDGQNKSGNDDHISVYLQAINVRSSDSMCVGWEVDAFFSILLYNQVSNKYLCFQGKPQRFHPMKSRWGFSKLISRQSLRDPGNGFLVDDKCMFGAEVAVINKSQQVIECLSLHGIGNPYKRDWKISNFSKLEEVWYSEEFPVGDLKWKVKQYPNGNNKEEGRSVSIYLVLAGAAHDRVKADYVLRIKNQLNDQHHCQRSRSRWFAAHTSSEIWGWRAFIPLSDMRNPKKGFVLEDCCIVEVEISVQAAVRDAI